MKWIALLYIIQSNANSMTSVTVPTEAACKAVARTHLALDRTITKVHNNPVRIRYPNAPYVRVTYARCIRVQVN